jgi:hypothetical protein
VIDRATNLDNILSSRDWYRGHGSSPVRHNFLEELAAAHDIHDFLADRAAAALPADARRERLSALVSQVALLGLVAQACAAPATGPVLLTVKPLHEPSVPCARPLAEAYREAFGQGLGLEATPLPEAATLLGVDAGALLLAGSHALPLALLEAGTHLFCLEHEGLLPARRARPLPDDCGPVDAVRATGLPATAVWRARRRGRGGGRPRAGLPPVVRVYEQKGGSSTCGQQTQPVSPPAAVVRSSRPASCSATSSSPSCLSPPSSGTSLPRREPFDVPTVFLFRFHPPAASVGYTRAQARQAEAPSPRTPRAPGAAPLSIFRKERFHVRHPGETGRPAAFGS